MTLKVSDLVQEIQMSTNAEQPSKWTSHPSIINQAIAYFNTMHPWDSMVSGEVTLDTVALATSIDLPSDFRDIIAVYDNQSTTNWIKWVDPGELTRLRAFDDDDTDSVGGYRICISRAVPTTGGGVTDRLEVYPAFSATASDVFVVRYRRKLEPVGIDGNTEGQFINIPAELEPLLRSVVRIFARGIEEEDEGKLWDRLTVLEASPFLDRFKEWDGAMQPEVGRIEGGAAQQDVADTLWFDSAIGDPS